MTVRIVTDSSSDIPSETARELDITVVPLSVRFGSQTYRDGIDIVPEEFYRRLVDEPVHPTTAASPGDFAGVYNELATGAGGISSIHHVEAAAAAAIASRERKIPLVLPSLQSIKERLRHLGKEEAVHPFVLRLDGIR